MRIGVLRVCFQVLDARSLKEKRKVLRPLKDRILSQFNVSVAEIGSNDKWQIGELGIVAAGNDSRFVESVMEKVKNFIDLAPQVRIIEHDIEVI